MVIGSFFKITPEIPKSPFEGIKTLADIKKEEIFLALRETREENWFCFAKRSFYFWDVSKQEILYENKWFWYGFFGGLPAIVALGLIDKN